MTDRVMNGLTELAEWVAARYKEDPGSKMLGAVKRAEVEIEHLRDANQKPSPETHAMGENPMRFFSENVDKWGAAEWFNRLANAIREQDKAVIAKDEISFETYRMIAASSAMTLVRDHEATVRAALATEGKS